MCISHQRNQHPVRSRSVIMCTHCKIIIGCLALEPSASMSLPIYMIVCSHKYLLSQHQIINLTPRSFWKVFVSRLITVFLYLRVNNNKLMRHQYFTYLALFWNSNTLALLSYIIPLGTIECPGIPQNHQAAGVLACLGTDSIPLATSWYI